MKACVAVFVCLLVTLAIVSSVLAQQPPGQNDAVEQEILNRLAAVNPSAVPVFQQATHDRNTNNLAAAKRGFEQVLELAPDFPDALRRLSYIETDLGDIEAGLQHARHAYEIQDSPYNRAALARALVGTKDRSKASEALTHAQAAARAMPDDPSINAILLESAAVANDMATVRQTTATLLRVLPEYPTGHYVAGLLAAGDGQWEKAEQELLLARKLGMPTETVQKALDDGITSQARLQRSLRWGGYTVAGWVVGLGALFLSGMLLSQLTLRAVRQPQPDPGFRASLAERLIRSIYRIVITITSLYFYVSIPFVILIVTVLAGGVFYFFVAIGHVPVQLSLMIGLATLYTIYAVIRSIFTRVKDEEPGRSLSRDEAPRLWSLAEQVAERVGTRPIDVIYVTPAPEVAVIEHGSLLRKLVGAGRRCLIIGLGALPGMTQGQFQAILAHEYGHFSNRDTAGGQLARQVHTSIYRMAYGLARRGQAHWYNPAWIFVNGYHRIFMRVTLGASRLQEILADRYAAIAYGIRNFVDGLQHIARQSLAFKMVLEEQAVTRRMRLQEIYAAPTFQSTSLYSELESKIADMMNQPTSPYDSHPAMRERIELVQQLNVSGGSGWGSQEPVWSLLPNAEQLQAEMTAVIQTNIDQQSQAA